MAGASGKKLDETYKLAWKRGLKTTYYLRTLGATSAEKSTGKGGELNAVSSSGGAHAVKAATSTASPVFAAPTLAPAARINPAVDADLPATDMKFCSIDSPDCEACQ